MWIVERVLRNGATNYIVQNDLGERKEFKGDVLKSQVRLGKITISNAKLTPSGRFYMLKDVKVPKAAPQKCVGEYKRTPEIQQLDYQNKVEYYFGTLLKNHSLHDMSIFTVDELDCILTGSLDLEICDRGNSTVDIILQRNLHSFGSVSAVIKECVRRKYLTEKECAKYLLGCDARGRVCNHYTFAEWIMKHKKGGSSEPKEKKEKSSMPSKPSNPVKSSDKEWLKMAYHIGHSWWQYLDEQYFGVKTNTIARVGQKYTSKDAQGMCGKYVCDAYFNSLHYDNMQGFLVGFTWSKKKPHSLIAHIYFYTKQIYSNGNCHAAYFDREYIVDTGVEKEFLVFDIESVYSTAAQELAEAVNNLASKVPLKKK